MEKKQEHVPKDIKPLVSLEEQRNQREAQSAKLENDMRLVLQQKVQQKQSKLKQSEDELNASHKEMKEALERQRQELESDKKKLNQIVVSSNAGKEKKKGLRGLLSLVTLEEKRHQHEENDMRLILQEKESKLKQSEDELNANHKEMKEALERQRQQLGSETEKFEQIISEQFSKAKQ